MRGVGSILYWICVAWTHEHICCSISSFIYDTINPPMPLLHLLLTLISMYEHLGSLSWSYSPVTTKLTLLHRSDYIIYVYESSCLLFRTSSYISSVCCRDFDLLILYTKLYMHPEYLLPCSWLVDLYTHMFTRCHIIDCLISHTYIYTCQGIYYHVSGWLIIHIYSYICMFAVFTLGHIYSCTCGCFLSIILHKYVSIYTYEWA